MNSYRNALRRTISTLLLACTGLLATALTGLAQPFGVTQDEPGGPLYRSADVLVQFKPGATDADLADAVGRGRLGLVKHIQTETMKRAGHPGLFHMATTIPVRQAVAALQNHPGVEFAEPNWIYQHQEVPNEIYFSNGQLWGMYGDLFKPSNQYGSQAAEAWNQGFIGSSDLVVGVVDEGIQVTHPDLSPNIWVNSAETPGDGIDNDRNGYVDDVNGWDFVNNDKVVYDDTGDDHGTHVAGTIGAVGGNGSGVVGINWHVKMASGKFLGPNGGSTADAVEAVDYFTALKSRGVNLVVLNNSWGGGGYSQALHDAIIRAAKAQILFVAAAGNGNYAGVAVNNDTTPYYPACYNTLVGTGTESAAAYDSVISVTAIDSAGRKASWANYGATTVDLGAPGVSIVSTLPNGYGSSDGTSMATPHVTGAIALFASTHPWASASQIKAAILGAKTPTTALAGKTVTGGRLNLSTVIQATAPTSVPGAPSGLTALALTPDQIKLQWSDNSDTETCFEITRRGGTTSGTFAIPANFTTYTDWGLEPGVTYSYTILAKNNAGASEPSNFASGTTLAWHPATATLVGDPDTITQGNWIGRYGSEGYDLVHYKQIPSYATLALAGNQTADPWHTGTMDVQDLLVPGSDSQRFSAAYSSSGEFSIDINFNDDRPHRVSLYCVDRDFQHRQQNITIVDAYSQTILSGCPMSGFETGQYLVWEISGHVAIRVSWIDNPLTGGDNAVVNGIFFDPVPTGDHLPTVTITSPAASATVSGLVPLTASATDDVEVKSVEFFVDGASVGRGTLNNNVWSANWNSELTPEGLHTLTARATDSVNQMVLSAPVSVTIDNLPSLHSGDLDGTRVTARNGWKATVTVTVHDATHNPVVSANVSGSWYGGATGTTKGTTLSEGTVTFTSPNINSKVASVGFVITGITATGYEYTASENHDAEGDSNGTDIKVLK